MFEFAWQTSTEISKVEGQFHSQKTPNLINYFAILKDLAVLMLGTISWLKCEHFYDVTKKRGRYRVGNFQNHKLLKILSVPIDTNEIKQLGLSLTPKLRYKSEILSTNFHQRK